MSMFRRRLLQQALAVPKPIAAYECYDLTNEQLADSPILPDLSGNGHDIALHNFAWAGMSGIGGYPVPPIGLATATSDGNELVSQYSVKVTKTGYTGMKVCTLKQNESATFKYRIEGVKEDYNFWLYTYLGSTATSLKRIIEDGDYEDTITNTEEGSLIVLLACRTSTEIPDMDMTITILPEHKGALVSDGVDDYGICETPLGMVGTIIAIVEDINWSSSKYLYNATSSIENGRIFCWKTSNLNIQCGLPPTNTPIENKFIIFTREPVEVDGIMFLFTPGGSNTVQVALYALEIYDRDLTDAQIAAVKARMIKQYESKTGLKYEEA